MKICFRPLWIAAVVVGVAASGAAADPFRLPVALNTRGVVKREASIALTKVASGAIYSVSVAVRSPGEFIAAGGQSLLRVTVEQNGAPLVSKTLHLGDPDLYVLVRFPASGRAEVKLAAENAPADGFRYHVAANRWPASARLASQPNHSWQQANPIELGTTVFGSGDEELYIPLDPQPGKTPPGGKEDWFRFEFREAKPKLVFFELDLMERDNIPVDVSVFRLQGGKPAAYNEGADPVTPPHEVQALEGNKFTTRVLREPGTYYVRVRARHPFYKLRTSLYDAPPYSDPREAVQTAVDYIIRAGDSWHANTPRKGGVYDRVANVHQETSLCVACHATHFSQRAQLYALENGYQVTGKQQLQFLAERFYNNPRPFYGFEDQGATWARVISAPANVLGRMAALLQIYEKDVTGEHRAKFFQGVDEYLKLYYKDRRELPPDESNGNTPLVSTYEVAWYAWVAAPELRLQLERLIAQDHIKNVCDLAYQTLALANIGKEKYRDQIGRNAERLLKLQRPDGQWALRFEPEAPEAEFQTGHVLWALQAAGVPRDNPQVAKGLRYLLGRQQAFGGWFDPLQSYENFRTPFRETQMAVLALSAYYHGPGKKDEPAQRLDGRNPVALLTTLDEIWKTPSQKVFGQIELAARSNDALVRQQAAECLGRLAYAPSAKLLESLLGDDSKMVQRTAAWALRQLADRKGVGAAEVEQALADRDDRTRWGATRVFATHFSYLVDRVKLDPLARLVDDPVPAIRMQAIKGLWQWWFWDVRRSSRDRIENTILTAMAAPQHPWVERNLREAVYNIADENVRYLYNNWAPLLANEQLRERAVEGRLAVEAALAEKFARVLETGSDHQKKMLLVGLGNFHLRRPDSYQAGTAGSKSYKQARYTRIGNDVEQIVFFGDSAERLARALLPLVESPDPEMRRDATLAAYLVRDFHSAPSYGVKTKDAWPAVQRLAGRTNEWRPQLALAVLERVEDPDTVARATALDIYKEFTQDFEGPGRARVQQVLLRLIESPRAESQRAALEVIAQAPAFPAASPLVPLVRRLALAGKQGAPAVAALQACPSLWEEPEIVEVVERAIESQDPARERAGLELVMRNQAQLEKPGLRAAFESVVSAPDAARRKMLRDIAQAHPEVKATELGAMISGKIAGRPRAATAAAVAANAEAGANLDYAYFRARIEPLLEARGPDGNACVNCHDTHTIFHLSRPGPEGATEAQLGQNYRSALRVVDVNQPENSLILRKPTSDSSVEGTVGATKLSHGGGMRWPVGSPQYQIILDWIRAAQPAQKAEARPAAAPMKQAERPTQGRRQPENRLH